MKNFIGDFLALDLDRSAPNPSVAEALKKRH